MSTTLPMKTVAGAAPLAGAGATAATKAAAPADTVARYAFVCGCPRSGTTATATLLNWHPSLIMGQERFALMAIRRPEAYLPALFETGRFGQFVEGDCARPNFEKSIHWDDGSQRPNKFRDIASCTVRGDKSAHVQELLNVLERPEWLDENVTVFAMLRDLDEVAASYEARLRDKSDAWQDDRFKALQDWKLAVESLSRLFSFRRTRFKIRIVCYEAVFDRGLAGMLAAVTRMYADLGLSINDEVRAGIARVAANTERRSAFRKQDPALAAELARRVPAATMKAFERLKDLAFVL